MITLDPDRLVSVCPQDPVARRIQMEVIVPKYQQIWLVDRHILSLSPHMLQT